MTEQKLTSPAPVTSYREVRIGRTTYQVTSVFLGQIDLGETLERLAAQKVLGEIEAGTKAAAR